jgi:hypothetical protein
MGLQMRFAQMSPAVERKLLRAAACRKSMFVFVGERAYTGQEFPGIVVQHLRFFPDQHRNSLVYAVESAKSRIQTQVTDIVFKFG